MKKHPGAGVVDPRCREGPKPDPPKPATAWVPGDRTKGAAGARAKSIKPRGVDPTTSEVEYDADDLEFQKAVEEYKRRNRRPFPTLRELLGIARSLGYRKVT